MCHCCHCCKCQAGYKPDAGAPNGQRAYCELYGQYPEMPAIGKWFTEGSCIEQPVVPIIKR
jgi:hypothetical protein